MHRSDAASSRRPCCMRSIDMVVLPSDSKALPHVMHSRTRCSLPRSCAPSLAVCELPLLGPCRATLPPVGVLVGGAGFEVRAAACPSLTGGTGDVVLIAGHSGGRH